MRFAELCLERYGRFEDHRLTLRDGSPDFHIIYGPNEAGKSTTLAAVTDLLFGIPQRSVYDFRFDYALMRIGAVLEEDGQRLACRRRKSRQQSLVDANEQPIDEGPLQAMLHGLTRESFGAGHSLDQAGLRRGGEAMMKANDDLGQALFAAGSGLTGIAGIQTELDQEADAIWGRRSAQRRTFTMAERQFEDSMRLLREQQLRPKEWTDARAAMVRREAELDALRQQQSDLTSRRRSAERLRRISPAARRRAALLTEIGNLGAVTMLSLQEEALVETTLAMLAKAGSDRELAERLRDDAVQRLAALAADPIVAHSSEIEALIERRGAIAKAETDRARLSIERRGFEENAAALRAELRADGELPSRLTIAKLRSITSRHAGATTSLRAHADSLADVQARAAPLKGELIDARLAEGLPGLRAAIALGRSLGDDFDERCADGLAAAQAAEHEADAALAQLAPWSGSFDGLARTPVLDEQEIQAAAAVEQRLADRIEAGRADRRRTEEALERIAAEAGRLTAAGQAVSAGDLAEARAARDTQWHEIDAHLRGGPALRDSAERAQAFAMAASAADAMADRRYDNAEASAQITALANRQAEQQLLLDQMHRGIDASDQEFAAMRAAWRDRLDGVTLPPLDPARLRGWYALRTAALSLHQAAIAARSQATRDGERRREAIDTIGAAMAAPPASAERLAIALTAAERERAEGEALEQAFADKRNRLAGYEEEINRLQRQLEQDRRAVAEARGEWDAEQAALGLSIDLGDVEAHLALIEQLRTELDAVRDRDQRIRGIAADHDRFEADIQALAEKLSMVTDAAAAETLDTLRSRLVEARAVAQQIASATEERDRRQAEMHVAGVAREAALARLEPVLARTGLDDSGALPATLDLSRRRRGLDTDLADAARSIVADGDGYALPDLIAAWEACDPDEIAGSVQDLDRNLADVNDAVSTAANALGEARRTFAALDERPHNAADAAADAEIARAEMAAQAEIYILKRAQSLTLRWAMDRYRERQQGPLLRRASELFAALTLDRFAELKVDYDAASPRLLGLRQDRETLVPIDGMSEGTTDQLFLALRLAALEQAIANGIRVPFLADDLFVNFDDDRAAAGLRVLAEIARSTQILFFTHHGHLRDIARDVVGVSAFSECGLA